MNNKKLVSLLAAITLVVVALVISLVFVFNGSDEESQSATSTSQTPAVSPQPVVMTPDGTQPTGEANDDLVSADPTTMEDGASDQPATGDQSGLPDNWDDLSRQEKIDLNPLGCDLTTQFLWASDGSCHPKPDTDEAPVPEPADNDDDSAAGDQDTQDESDTDDSSDPVCPPGYRHLEINNIDQCLKDGEVSTKYPIDAWRDYRNAQNPKTPTTTTTTTTTTDPICPPGYRQLQFNDVHQCQKEGETVAEYPDAAWKKYRQAQNPQTPTTTTTTTTTTPDPVCPPGYRQIQFNNVDQCQKEGAVVAVHPPKAWQDYRQAQNPTTTTTPTVTTPARVCPPDYRQFSYKNVVQCAKDGEVMAQTPDAAWRSYRADIGSTCPPGYRQISYNNAAQCVEEGDIMSQFPDDAWREFRTASTS